MVTAGDGRQARWQRHNEERRRRVIDAAIELIEEAEPGAEVHVQQIAVRAGVNRTVVYRYFEDRADLDRAVQTEIIERLSGQLLPALTLDGTAPQIIDRVVGGYVDWAVAHPALHHVADHDNSNDGTGPLEQGLEKIAAQVGEIIAVAMLALGGVPTQEDAEALDPMVYGLVGSVFGAVRRWINRPERTLSATALKRVVSQSVWFVIDGHARRMGLVIDPDRPVEELLAAATALMAAATVAP